MKIKISKFSVFVPECPNRDSCVVFSTLSRGIVQLPLSLYESIANGKNINENSYAVNLLKSAGIVIDEDIDENQLFIHWSNSHKYNKYKSVITLLMTYGCNCACKYCYEEGTRTDSSKTHITHDMSKKVIEWIKNYVLSRQSSVLDLCFHGGEPLLTINEIEFIATKLREFCEKQGIKHAFSITTNGTLLTPNIANRLSNADVDRVQITLDGPKAINDKRRPLINGDGTFDIIMKNIVNAVDKLNIDISMVIDEHNYDSLFELIDILASKGLQKKLHMILFSTTISTKAPLKHISKYGITYSQYAKYNIELSKKFIEKGFNVEQPFLIGLCTQITDGHVVLNSLGDIYKCISGSGTQDKNFKIGNISDDLNTLSIRASRFVVGREVNNERCMDCTYRPMCNGGCRYRGYLKSGDLTEGECMKGFYEKWVPGLIKILYKNS